MIVVYCQPRGRLSAPEQAMVDAMRELPGILLVSALATLGRRSRELDGLWLHPGGLAVIEAKGTFAVGPLVVRANGPWKVGDAEADFASGPNPILQARTGAQMLRSALERRGVQAGFIPAVVAVHGPGLRAEPQVVGDVVVTLSQDLPDLRAHLRQGRLGAPDVCAVLAALDLDGADQPDTGELAGEGFDLAAVLKVSAIEPPAVPAAGKAPTGSTSKERRRERRVAELAEQAEVDWRRMNRRRVIASGVAGAVMVAAAPQLPAYCVAFGVLFTVVTGAYQLVRRRLLSGKRQTGRMAAAAWLLTLVPVGGIGASLAAMAALPGIGPERYPYVLLLSVLGICGLACAILTGRSSYVNPPAMVIERHDAQGRPTGALTLAQASPLSMPGRS